MDLFEHSQAERIDQEQPLAARMRPRTLDEFVGQEHILAPGRLLRRAIRADQLSSLIFHGPPGTGKTTLAAVIANSTQSHFETLNAVLAGIPDIRRVTEEARRRMAEHGRRTILFVDEVHRWNKAQQDALLPWVENGSVILIGATTENPYFTVNRALVSRSRIFQLQPLTEDDLEKIAQAALVDEQRGYGRLQVELATDAIRHIVNVANGDARAVLNALELAVETTEKDRQGRIIISMAVAEESIQKRAVLYDKEGDYHFDTISAFIKSMRGSDPDATMYWLAKMVYAGEDPRFIFRRMLIFASEDVGLADPRALTVAEAAAAFDRVGLPEGQYHLAMAALYLATSFKSNSVFAYFDALATVEKEREGEVPSHLKDGHRDQQGFGHGQGYSYPHAYREHWVAQQYLPATLQGKLFYRPGQVGYEQELSATVARRREAQLAAALEAEQELSLEPILTTSPQNRRLERWLARAAGAASDQLAEVRGQLFERAACRAHHRVLCLGDDYGLLVWEAIRQTPEGGVHVQLGTKAAARNLQARLADCPDLRMPELHCCGIRELPPRLAGKISFERIVGRNIIFNRDDKPVVLQELHKLLPPNGRLILAEPISRHSPRLADFLNLPGGNSKKLIEWFREVEEEIYANPHNPMVNWDEKDASGWFEQAGFAEFKLEVVKLSGERHFSRGHLEEWFKQMPDNATRRPGLGQLLRQRFDAEKVQAVRQLLDSRLVGRSFPWTTKYLMAMAKWNSQA